MSLNRWAPVGLVADHVGPAWWTDPVTGRKAHGHGASAVLTADGLPLRDNPWDLPAEDEARAIEVLFQLLDEFLADRENSDQTQAT